MNNRLSCCRLRRLPAINARLVLILAALLLLAPQSFAGDWLRFMSGTAPDWMHALTTVALPEHDEKTDAVLLYAERTVTVLSADKMKVQVRVAYKILRPGGRDYGIVNVSFNPQTKITHLHGWCIPAEGKDYEVKDKDAIEIALPKIENSELVNDVKEKVLEIPAAEPGNIVGYEYETEENPLLLEDIWNFQKSVPVVESHYQLILPAGWEFKVSWLNAPAGQQESVAANASKWVVRNLAGIREEADMPAYEGVAGRMIVSFQPSGQATAKSYSDWAEMGSWYNVLTKGRRDSSPAIRQKAEALAAAQNSTFKKVNALAEFVQRDIRYVAIELGIGGMQPHPAEMTFNNRYGDCKDKATLLASMLHEIGVESFYVLIDSERGAVASNTKANGGAFDHVILAIQVPAGMILPEPAATLQHPRLGKLLFFDPTSETDPLGALSGTLQSNWGLLVTPEGGELTQLPQMPVTSSGIRRTAHFSLDIDGALQGEMREERFGDAASQQRYALRSATRDTDQIKPIESLLNDSLSSFHLEKAQVVNLQNNELPFEYVYSFSAANYAKRAGGLMVVRPRVLGTWSRSLLEKKEARKFPVVFDGPSRYEEDFVIALPHGYVVDDLPQPVDVDFGFANYHAKTVLEGNALHYVRSHEIKELTVPLDRIADLKKLYRIIASDERSTAVLRPAAQ